MALTPEKVQQMKVDELKVEMRKRGLKVSGSKSELLRRLREDDESAMKRARITNNDGKYYSGRAESQCDAFLAAGEFRNVFVGLYTQGPRAGQKAVKKVFKTGCVYEDAFFRHDIQTVTKATELIARFNQEMSGKVGKKVFLNQPEVWHQIEPDFTGKHPKCLVEPFIDGTYIKFNSNSGYADEDYAYMQALSHFTYHFTNGRYVVCDLQGGRYSDRYVLTDPVVLSADKEFGPTDLGQSGIDNFFIHHKCGKWCQPNWKRPAVKPAVPLFRPVKGTTFIMR